MNRLLSLLLAAAIFVLTSFNTPQKTCYAYAVVQSTDYKTIYFSSVFTYEEKDYYKLSKWADIEFTDQVSDFKSGGSQIYPSFSASRTSKEKVKESRARLIASKRSLATQRVELVSFPSSKD